MGGEEDAADAVVAQSLDVVRVDHLDAAVRGVDVDLAEMRVLGGDAAQIVPHAADHSGDLAIGRLAEGVAQVARGDPADAGVRSDRATEPAAQRRGAVDRQRAEQGEREPRAPGLQPVRRIAPDAAARHRAHRPSNSGASRRSSAAGSAHSRRTRSTSIIGRASSGRRTWSFSVVTSAAPSSAANSTSSMISSAS